MPYKGLAGAVKLVSLWSQVHVVHALLYVIAQPRDAHMSVLITSVGNRLLLYLMCTIGMIIIIRIHICIQSPVATQMYFDLFMICSFFISFIIVISIFIPSSELCSLNC